jgi:hypothetical protein
MNEELDTPGQSPSPFDGLKHTDENGEYWLARELYSPAGYSTWQKFEPLITQAQKVLEGISAGQDQVTLQVNQVPRGLNTGYQDQADYRCTRYGAYMILSRSHKPALADYFVIQTMFAENVQRQELSTPPVLPLLSAEQVIELGCAGATEFYPDGRIKAVDPARSVKERARKMRRETTRKARERDQIPMGMKWAPEVLAWFKLNNDGATEEQIVRHAARSLGAAVSIADVQLAFTTAKAFLRSDVATAAYEDRFGSTRFGIDLAFSLSDKTMECYQTTQARERHRLTRGEDSGYHRGTTER